MRQFNWQDNGTEFTLTFPEGKAIIREGKRDGKTVFFTEIKDAEGRDIKEFHEYFNDFETAAGVVSIRLIELDSRGEYGAAFYERLAQSLDRCIPLLAEPNRMFDKRRIENIQWWLRKQKEPDEPVSILNAQDELVSIPDAEAALQAAMAWFVAQMGNVDRSDLSLTNWKEYNFVWQGEGERFFADVPPHGRACLVKQIAKRPMKGFSYGVYGEMEAHDVEIHDSTGLIYKDIYFPGGDFAAAEERLRELLFEFERPFIDEVLLEKLIFTLDICEHLLPPETPIMDFVRLDYIKGDLGQTLP